MGRVLEGPETDEPGGRTATTAGPTVTEWPRPAGQTHAQHTCWHSHVRIPDGTVHVDHTSLSQTGVTPCEHTKA